MFWLLRANGSQSTQSHLGSQPEHHRNPRGAEVTPLLSLQRLGMDLGWQSCPTLCSPMDCSTPGLLVHHQLLELAQICPLSQWGHPAISFSVVPFSSCLQSFPASGSFPMSQFFTSGDQSIGVSASASILPVNTQDLSPLGWTGWISLQSKGPTPQFKSISSLVLSLLHSPTLTSKHDHWKNHSLDQMDLCWQSNVSAF